MFMMHEHSVEFELRIFLSSVRIFLLYSVANTFFTTTAFSTITFNTAPFAITTFTTITVLQLLSLQLFFTVATFTKQRSPK